MKVELNRGRIDNEIISWLEQNYTVEHYNDKTMFFEVGFIFQGNYDVLVPFNIESGNIIYKKDWVSIEYRKNSKVDITVKVINRNPNPNIETLQERFDEFMANFEREHGLDDYKFYDPDMFGRDNY